MNKKPVTDYSAFLKRGKENSTPAAILAQMAGFKDTRSLQADIARSRIDGQVICSASGGGYYLPADRGEIREFVHTLEARAKNTLMVLRSARQAMREIEGQLSIHSETNECRG